jgi:hypothetical protein
VSAGVWRRYALAFVCFAATGLIVIGAILDHRWKQMRLNRAEISAWYCVHQGARCGGPSAARIERHWNERQLGYEIAAAGLAVAGLIAAARQARR